MQARGRYSAVDALRWYGMSRQKCEWAVRASGAASTFALVQDMVHVVQMKEKVAMQPH